MNFNLWVQKIEFSEYSMFNYMFGGKINNKFKYLNVAWAGKYLYEINISDFHF